jgi:AcrR family transcriptional regulator
MGAPMRSRRRPRPSQPAPLLLRRRPRQPRAIVTIDAVLIAVERILDAHGPSGLTTNRVAEVAGVSIGSVYQYYSNKQALIGAVQERVLGDLFGIANAVAARVGLRTHVGASSRTSAEIDVAAISRGAIAAITDVLANIAVADAARH